MLGCGQAGLRLTAFSEALEAYNLAAMVKKLNAILGWISQCWL